MQIKPELKRDYEHWKSINSKDFYSRGVVDFMEQWAGLMEASGRPVAEVATATGHKANTCGITGFMYGAAVAALAKFWIHGEELRRWHNLRIQIGREGEAANEKGTILNPALVQVIVS